MVAAFWALPNGVHAVLQTAQIPTTDLVPLKFGLLAWASSICLSGQLTSIPVASPPPLVNKGMWPPDQLHPLLECSILPVCSVELLHQIVRHAYGSLSHDTAYTVLTAAAISDADAWVLQRHDRTLEVHMGGTDGWAPSSTCLGASTGQGCPMSGMKYCIYGQVKGHEACRDIPPVMTPAGKLNRVLLMDDT